MSEGPRGHAVDLVETKCSVTTSRRLCHACTSTKRNVNLPVQIQPNRPLLQCLKARRILKEPAKPLSECGVFTEHWTHQASSTLPTVR